MVFNVLHDLKGFYPGLGSQFHVGGEIRAKINLIVIMSHGGSPNEFELSSRYNLLRLRGVACGTGYIYLIAYTYIVVPFAI